MPKSRNDSSSRVGADLVAPLLARIDRLLAQIDRLLAQIAARDERIDDLLRR
jgi:hypothetical protein